MHAMATGTEPGPEPSRADAEQRCVYSIGARTAQVQVGEERLKQL